jgi:hypothetical protein
MFDKNRSEHVVITSIGQTGGITAHTVNLAPPPPQLEILAERAGKNPDGTFFVQLETAVKAQTAPGRMLIELAAQGLLSVTVMPPAIGGVSTMAMHNVRRSDAYFRGEVLGPSGKYLINIVTREEPTIEIRATF